jgi:hypothetical protein
VLNCAGAGCVYSDQRFNRLFRALDRNGSDSLSFEDLATVLFDETGDDDNADENG